MAEFKETQELISWLGDLASETIQTAAGGIQGNELINFSDELVGSFKGVGGFPGAAKPEALTTTAEDVEQVWAAQERKIAAAIGPDGELLAKGIVSNLKGVHALVAHAVQKRAESEGEEEAAQ